MNTNTNFRMGNEGLKVMFWEDCWCEGRSVAVICRNLSEMANSKGAFTEMLTVFFFLIIKELTVLCQVEKLELGVEKGV